MSRRSFLIGHLTGLVLGVLVMLAVNRRTTTQEPAVQPQFIPVSRTEKIDGSRLILIPPGETVPTEPKGHSFEFNGQKVYVIPLAHADQYRPR